MYNEQCRSAEIHFFPEINVTYMWSCWAILPFNPAEHIGSFRKSVQTCRFLEEKERKDKISGIMQTKTELLPPKS